MPQRPSGFDHLPALDPTTLLCLEIDIELRNAWELLDQANDTWDDGHLAVIASAMRVAFVLGRRAAGSEDGDSALADAPA